MKGNLLFFFVILITLISFSIQDEDFLDISSFSNINEIKQNAIDINVFIDFDEEKVIGDVKISFEAIKITDKIILDSKFLNIFNVTNSDTKESLKFSFDEDHKIEALGTPLVIQLTNPLNINDKFNISISYETTKDSAAVQWLGPEKTLGKQYPFMFTQCEAILCRTLLPCQDTPSVKVLVNAALTVKKPLTALYAGIRAKNPVDNGDLITYFYKIKTKIPTYLIAIAAGSLETRNIGPRTNVWAEKELVDASAWEFKETESFIQTAEHYATPYEWFEYNILVLPPGFPYGGMENPCLTFATPSLIAGDRSLANVIAHEISHSWTGNLVTMRDWRNFWLNEGFTVFLERKIIELTYGEDMAKLQAQVGYAGYLQDVENFGKDNSYTSLFPDIQKNDPDDAFSSIPYEKGFNFLYYLQSLTGKDIFNKIFKSYIQNFKYKSIDYTDFQNFFISNLEKLASDKAKDILSKVDWETWIKSPGLPPIKNDFTNKYYIEAQNAVADFFNNKLTPSFVSVFKPWNTNVKLVFLNLITERFQEINDKLYAFLRDNLGLNIGYNSEIKNLWYQLALNLKHSDVIPSVEDFLGKIGRMKYIRPIYKSYGLMDKKSAYACFEKNKNIYHPVAIRLIIEDFKKIPDNSFVEIEEVDKLIENYETDI